MADTARRHIVRSVVVNAGVHVWQAMAARVHDRRYGHERGENQQ